MASSQEFLQSFPIMSFPACCETFAIAGWEAGVIEDDFRSGALLEQFEMGDGVDSGVPFHGAPGLNDSLVGDQLDLASGNVGSKDAERSAGFAADHCVKRHIGALNVPDTM